MSTSLLPSLRRFKLPEKLMLVTSRLILRPCTGECSFSRKRNMGCRHKVIRGEMEVDFVDVPTSKGMVLLNFQWKPIISKPAFGT